MNQVLSDFAARLCGVISSFSGVAAEVTRLQFQEPETGTPDLNRSEPPYVGCYEIEFNALALELFALQFKYNAVYRKICESRGLTPDAVEHWAHIPAVPTAAFRELEFSCIPPEERTAVFHSSGTTEQKPSRHFHSVESLNVYETSLLPWFLANVWPDLRFTSCDLRLICLTPPPEQVPHSSLVHMFETVRRRAGQSTDRSFFGTVAADGSWLLDYDAVIEVLSSKGIFVRSSRGNEAQIKAASEVRASSRRLLQPVVEPVILLGTAFSFVHLLDDLGERDLRFQLPPGSRVMETGGYKNRSRAMPKDELHALITARLGVTTENIICEYGLSELSSQAYDGEMWRAKGGVRNFHFPPWARAQIISPETAREAADGETGLIRLFDLANIFSVAAIQTEDLGVRRGGDFELIGRAQAAEPRGCSLMSA